MKKSKQLSLRVSELAKALIEAEKNRTGDSESDIVERCLLIAIRTPEALALIRDHAIEDPMLAAIVSAVQDIERPARSAKRGEDYRKIIAEMKAVADRMAAEWRRREGGTK